MADSIYGIINFIKTFIAIFVVMSITLVFVFKYVNPPFYALGIERSIFSKNNKPPQWVNYFDISDEVKIAVIAAEDQNFVNHSGFDFNRPENIRPYDSTIDITQDSSTITQQVAKNLFLWSSGSGWFYKGLESWYTLWIELFWSKQRILDVYLNTAECGEGIFGIEAASRYYFDLSANQLTPEQACSLAAILPNPRYLNIKYPAVNLQQRISWIEKQAQAFDKTLYLGRL